MHEVMITVGAVYAPYPSIKVESDKEIKINMACYVGLFTIS